MSRLGSNGVRDGLPYGRTLRSGPDSIQIWIIWNLQLGVFENDEAAGPSNHLRQTLHLSTSDWNQDRGVTSDGGHL